jgi:hypothetical protein
VQHDSTTTAIVNAIATTKQTIRIGIWHIIYIIDISTNNTLHENGIIAKVKQTAYIRKNRCIRANISPTGSKQHANGRPIILSAKHRATIAATAAITAETNATKNDVATHINIQDVPTNPPHGIINEIAHSIDMIQDVIHIIRRYCTPIIKHIIVNKQQANIRVSIVGIAQQIIPIQVRTEQIIPIQVRTEQIIPIQVRTEQIIPIQVRTEQVRTEQIIPIQVRTEQIIPIQVRTEQVRTEQIIPIQVRTEQIIPIQVRTEQVRTEQIIIMAQIIAIMIQIIIMAQIMATIIA